MNDSDILLLRYAVDLAERGRFTCAPNPTVGCVVVKDGRVLGRGWHKKAGEGHAEVEAIKDAGGDVQGSTVYVSLEPCAFEGRTPACAQTLVKAGVRKVVMAALDPHPKVSGKGVEILQAAGIDTQVYELPEATAAIRGFRSIQERGRPWVRIKTASSLDGATALANGESKWITGPSARQDVQYWRARSDAIVTGVGTVLADDPALTVRSYEAKPPLRVILDSALSISNDAQVMRDGGGTLVVHCSDEPPRAGAKGVEYLNLDPKNLDALLVELGQRGCNEVLVEAGAKVVGSFVKAGLWDEWIAYVAPKIMGDSSAHVVEAAYESMTQVPEAEVVNTKMFGNDVRLTLRNSRQ